MPASGVFTAFLDAVDGAGVKNSDYLALAAAIFAANDVRI